MRRLWLTLVLASCLEPTEVKVRLTSDACDSIAETEIFLGNSTTASATTTACGAQIGSIVMIPASARDATFTVRVSACDKPKAHCIKASRRVGFVQHTPLELPIALDRSCVDVTCSADQTCSKGGCVPDDVSKLCVGNVCAPPLPDGGPSSCAPPWVNPPSGASAIIWHFDDPLPHHDDNLQCAPSTLGTGPGMTGCKNAQVELGYDGGASMVGNLGCDLNPIPAGTSFHVAFWFRVSAMRASNLLAHVATPGGQSQGWSFVTDGLAQLTFQAHVANVTSDLTLSGSLDSGTWHAVEVLVSNGVLTAAWFDKQPVTVAKVMVTPSPNTPILIGPLQGAALDELYIYP